MLKKIRLHRHDFTYATPRERPATGASQKRNAVTKIKFYPQRSAQNEKEKTQMLHQQKKMIHQPVPTGLHALFSLSQDPSRPAGTAHDRLPAHRRRRPEHRRI